MFIKNMISDSYISFKNKFHRVISTSIVGQLSFRRSVHSLTRSTTRNLVSSRVSPWIVAKRDLSGSFFSFIRIQQCPVSSAASLSVLFLSLSCLLKALLLSFRTCSAATALSSYVARTPYRIRHLENCISSLGLNRTRKPSILCIARTEATGTRQSSTSRYRFIASDITLQHFIRLS